MTVWGLMAVAEATKNENHDAPSWDFHGSHAVIIRVISLFCLIASCDNHALCGRLS